MFNNVVFYNRNHNGDVFESREFVKALTYLIPSNRFFYLHENSNRLLKDIDNIISIKPKKWSQFTPNIGLLSRQRNSIFINTWIGNGRYGCTVENNFYMFNDVLINLGLGVLPGNPIDYLPKINYHRYDISNIDKFFSVYKGDSVYIDNGDVKSLQASNFDFTPIIIKLATDNPNTLFITSQPISKDYGNILSSKEIIGCDLDNDLMENSYISRFCRLVVGRNSGPFVVTCTDENLFNKNKTFISFCYEQKVSTFHVNQNVLSKQVWSGCTNANDVFNVINNELLE